MIEHDGRTFIINKGEITDTHGNTHGWFCRVQSADGRWRVVRGKHRLEKFPMQRSGDAVDLIVDEVTRGLSDGTLMVEERPGESAPFSLRVNERK